MKAAGGVRVEVSGRLCLFGEHSDWAAAHPSRLAPGACLAVGTDQTIRMRAAPLAGRAFRLRPALPRGEPDRPPFAVSLEKAALEAAVADPFYGYVAGVAREMIERFPSLGGLALDGEAMDLPLRKGLSSSAAIGVLVVRAFAAVHRLALGVRDEMEIAYLGERRAGSACGRLDQVCAFGRVPVRLAFEGEAVGVAALAPRHALYLLIVDLAASKDTKRILADLNACFAGRDDAVARRVRAALGPRNLALVGAATAALEAGDAKAVGEAMRDAQALFDRDVAPASAALASPRLRALLGHAAVRELALGGKGVGSQGDGSAQLVCAGPGERAALARRIEDELGLASFPLTIPAAAAPPPARSACG